MMMQIESAVNQEKKKYNFETKQNKYINFYLPLAQISCQSLETYTQHASSDKLIEIHSK